MRGGLSVVFLIAGCATSALAGGYDDYNRAVTDNIRGNRDAAIAAFTSALAANDLPKTYVRAAHLGRARAYLTQNRCAEALPDLDASLALAPDDVEALMQRQWTDLCLHRPDDAKADFNKAFPRPDAFNYTTFAFLNWRFAYFDQAAAGYLKAFDASDRNDKTRFYLLLWYAMSAIRAGSFDQSAYATRRQQFDSSDWPAPLLDFYAGKSTIADVRAQTDSINAERAKNHQCEADFYAAEWNLAHNVSTDVVTLLKAAVAECANNRYEREYAEIELKRQSNSNKPGVTP